MFSRPRRQAKPTPVSSHQTVTLARGKHLSPDNGACVMELSSMLAGEPFTDHPLSVCPVIASFLRMYNDSIDNQRRQDLYEYASKVIDSRANEEVKLARADRLATWAHELRRQRRNRLLARSTAAGALPRRLAAALGKRRARRARRRALRWRDIRVFCLVGVFCMVRRFRPGGVTTRAVTGPPG